MDARAQKVANSQAAVSVPLSNPIVQCVAEVSCKELSRLQITEPQADAKANVASTELVVAGTEDYPPNDDRQTLVLQHKIHKMLYSCGATTKLDDALTAFVKQYGKEECRYKLMFDDVLISAADTPETLGLTTLDIVRVVLDVTYKDVAVVREVEADEIEWSDDEETVADAEETSVALNKWMIEEPTTDSGDARLNTPASTERVRVQLLHEKWIINTSIPPTEPLLRRLAPLLRELLYVGAVELIYKGRRVEYDDTAENLPVADSDIIDVEVLAQKSPSRSA